MQDSSREENSLCCAKESCRDSEDDGDDKNSHTSLRLIEVNILGLDLLVKGFDSSYVKTDCHDGIRARLACLVEELRELCGQISDEDGKLLFTVETSQDEASCLLKNGNQVYLPLFLFFPLHCTFKSLCVYLTSDVWFLCFLNLERRLAFNLVMEHVRTMTCIY